MPRSDPPIDASSALAFIAFVFAAAVWIGSMATEPSSGALKAAAIVMTKDVVVALPPPRFTEIADLTH
jgi:hypothetical protein